MAKKNLTENQNEEFESTPETTKPVKTGRKIFKDNQTPAVYADAEDTEITFPVNIKTKTRKPAVEPLEVAGEPKEPVTNSKPNKVRRAKWVWLGILIMLVITAIGAGIGYSSALQARITADTNLRLEKAATQFLKAEQDITAGDFAMASQRLQYIMTIYPAYPGLDEKLKEVLTAMAMANPETNVPENTPETAFTPVATKDTSAVNILFPQAQNQLNAGDWQGLLDTVNKMRNIDPSYEALKVDGFYYYALINTGINKIKSGDLEVGLYYFSMAAQIAPLHSETLTWANWARMFLEAGSWYGIDYYKSTELFSNVAQQVPNMVDASGYTSKQRYVGSMVGIGDVLMKAFDYCNAALQYSAAKDILSSDELLLKLQKAEEYCANPPVLPTPTLDSNAPEPTATPDSYNPTD
jgi:hypothetical protein